MLAQGSTTLWETWEPSASQCQGTGAAPVYLFARYLAGLYPREPGYRVIGLDPHPCGLDTVQATLNTPHGEVRVQWQRQEERIVYHLRVPRPWSGFLFHKPENVGLSVDYSL
jgi:alpha-L-rhamnosidase